MIKSACHRINDIANNLLLESKNNLSIVNDTKQNTTSNPELIFIGLENIISEKKYEYYNKRIDLQLEVSEEAYNSFSTIDLTSFKRVISNLINNSVEALQENGKIILSIFCDDNYIKVQIKDNGCGIPKEMILKVTEQGFSFNKKNGAGIGLSHAKEYIEMAGGKFDIESTVNVGTTITITLVKCLPPQWFCENLILKETNDLVIVDDDLSIHDTWKEKLFAFSNINMFHFTKASDLELQISNFSIYALYLIDYELLKDKKNGLDVIEKLNLFNQAILVTSCFEDPKVRKRCEELHVKILPKSYVPYINVNLVK